jgi:cytochrome b561
MRWRNTAQQYGWISIALHWLMALVIVAMFALGVWMRTLGYYDAWYHAAPDIHKSAGMLLLFVLLFRWLWRMLNVRPALTGNAWEQFMALGVHHLHYILLLLLMVTGYLIPTAEGVGIDVFGWFTVPALMSFNKDTADLVGAIHKYTAWAVIGLAGIHTAAALKHHFVDKDDILLRMLGISQK